METSTHSITEEQTQIIFRTLTASEKVIRLIDLSAPFNIQMILKLEGDVQSDTLRTAIDQLQQAHPLLSVMFADSGFDLIACPANIPLIQYSDLDDSEWQKIHQDDLNITTVKENFPLARFVLRAGEGCHELIFTINHTIADGLSVVACLQELFNIYAALLKNQKGAMTHHLEKHAAEYYITSLKLPPKKEDVLPLPEIEHTASGEYVKVFTKRLSESASSALIQQAKAKNLSVHSVICAAVVRSLYQLYSDNEGRSLEELCCMTSTDLRSRLNMKAAATELGYFVACLFTDCPAVIIEDFWALAAQIQNDLKTQMSNNNHFYSALAQEELIQCCQNEQDLVQRIKIARPMVGVTNMGKIALHSSCEAFTIKELVFSASLAQVWDHAYAFFVAAGLFQNRLQLHLFCTLPTVKEATAHAMLEKIHAELCRETCH